MAAKDISSILTHFNKETMGNKGKAKISLYSEIDHKVDVIPTGIEAVDKATSIGGLPRGRIAEIYGPESGGKSWISMKVGGSAQRIGLRVAMVDVEHTFDPVWGKTSAGLDADASSFLYGSDFDSGEDALQHVIGLCNDKVADVIIVDSTAALIPKAELEANLEDAQMGKMGQMMSRAIRQISDACAKSNTLVIFVNQVRDKVGVMFGNPETTPGGRALKFYSSMRLRVARQGKPGMGTSDDGEEVPAYIESKLQVIKNKVGRPFGEATFRIDFATSTDPYVLLVQKACDLGLLRRRTDEDDKKVFVWGKGKTAEMTGAEYIPQMAEWITSSVKVKELIEMIKVAAKEKGVVIDPAMLDLPEKTEIEPTST